MINSSTPLDLTTTNPFPHSSTHSDNHHQSSHSYIHTSRPHHNQSIHPYIQTSQLPINLPTALNFTYPYSPRPIHPHIHPDLTTTKVHQLMHPKLQIYNHDKSIHRTSTLPDLTTTNPPTNTSHFRTSSIPSIVHTTPRRLSQFDDILSPLVDLHWRWQELRLIANIVDSRLTVGPLDNRGTTCCRRANGFTANQ